MSRHNKTWPLDGFPFDRDRFDPDTVNLMSQALKAAIEQSPFIRSVAEDSRRRLAMAGRIMALAANGERDLQTLTRAALDGSRGAPPSDNGTY
jgi:hypothetical protein